MLVGSVAGIDDGHGRHLAGILRRPFQVVAHDNDVGIVGHHHDGILQRFALSAAGHLGVGKSYHLSAKAVGRRLEAETGAGAGLEEEGCHDATFQQTTVGMPLKLLSHTNEILNLLAGMMSYGYKASGFHC